MTLLVSPCPLFNSEGTLALAEQLFGTTDMWGKPCRRRSHPAATALTADDWIRAANRLGLR
ncbi:MAG TPA: hypothetical protein VNM90_06310 [Haliangium sp.]|nr:hypothetical protein [Haliangium sp.]